MRSQPLIIGNWKMHMVPGRAVEFAADLVHAQRPDGVKVVICPPFPSLCSVGDVIKGSGIELGGQNVHFEDEGAYTGEVSAPMLVDCGCKHVIIGHSERRGLFKECDDMVNKKVRSALRCGLVPIICVGETEQERSDGKTEQIVSKQLVKAVHGLTADEVGRVIIAYEPVWAIGSGKAASPAQAAEVHGFLRKLIDDAHGVGKDVPVLYGGSVKPDNAGAFLSEPDVDGSLVGGASLKVDAFVGIIEQALS